MILQGATTSEHRVNRLHKRNRKGVQGAPM